MNLAHLAVLITAARIANAAAPSSTSLAQPPNRDAILKSQQSIQSLTRVNEIQRAAPKPLAPLDIFLRLNPKKWANTPHAQLAIARLIPKEGSSRQLGERDLERLVGKIKKSIVRWNAVCNKTSPLYTAVLDPSPRSIRAQDEGIITFTGPIVGVLRYINETIAKNLPKEWELDKEVYDRAPFVDIGAGNKNAVKALLQAEDIQFAVFDLFAFILGFEGEEEMHYNHLD